MYLSLITLNVNGLSAPIKRHRVAEWIRKQDPHLCCLQNTHLSMKHAHRLKVKGCQRYFMQMNMKKNAGVTILIYDKIDFKT